MASRLQYLLCLLFAALALAAKPLHKELCVASCYYSTLAAKFSAASKADQTVCTNPLKVTSTYYCIYQKCGPADMEAGFAWYSLSCKKSSKVVSLDLYHEATSNVTAEFLASLPTIAPKDKTVFDTPALPSKKLFDPISDTVITYNAQREFNLKVRWANYAYWGLVILVGTLHNLWFMIDSKRSDEQNKESNPPGKGRLSKVRSWFNANILMAPSFGYHHHQPLGWATIPLRIQSLVILGWFLMQIFIMLPHYNIFPNNYYYKTIEGQRLRYIGDRIAHLMSSSLPLIFLFAGRANLLVYATGWSSRVFNVFHRWIGQIVFFEALLHGSIFSAYYVTEKGHAGYISELKTDVVFKYGIMMATALGCTRFISLGPFRQHVYELFKYMHIAFTAIFLAAYYFHVKDQFSGYYLIWLWACVGLWVGDYFLRILRILVLNYKTFIGDGIPALASYSEETGMIRLQVRPSVMAHRQTPGTYYFLYFASWRIWENHPFTLAGRTIEVEETMTSSPEQSDRDSSDRAAAPLPHKRVLTNSTRRNEYLTFMMKPREGFTSRLRDSLRREDGSYGQRRVHVLLDGPYGVPARLSHFDHVLFIAGGSGITTVLPYLRMFFEDRYDGHIPTVKLAWSVRDEGFARDVLANDLRMTESAPLAAKKLQMDFFVTKAEADEKRLSKNIAFRRERPNVDALVEDFVARNNSGRLAVFVCGPAQMADKTRLAVMRQVRKGYDKLELFEEMFVI